MKRGIVVGLVVVSMLAGVPAGVGGQTGVFVSDTTTTPRSPTVGDRVEITATISNPTITEFQVSSVTLRTTDGRQLERREPDVTVGRDSEGTVSVSRVFDDPGSRTLEVVIRGTRGGVPVTLTTTVTVEIDTVAGPDAAVVADEATVGRETTVSVVLSNAADERLRDVSVRLRGSFTANRTRYVLPAVAAGASRTFDFGVTFAASGKREVTAVIEYVTADGRSRRLVRNLTVAVDPARRDAAVSARLGSGARPPLVTTVTNLGNVPLSDPLVVVTDDGRVVGRATLRDVPVGASRTVRVNLSNATGPVTVRVTYTAAGERRRIETTTNYTTNPAQIRLTGLEVTRENGQLRLSGSASNVGMAPARSVLVAVVPEQGVEPTGPNPEFFVGRVGASEFVSFELSAEITDRTSVPIRVTWIGDGRRHSTVVTVEVEPRSTPAVRAGSSVPDTPVVAGAAVVGLLVVALMGYGLYNSLS